MAPIPKWGWAQWAVRLGNRFLDWVNVRAKEITWASAVMLAFFSAAEWFGYKDDLGRINLIAITGFLTGLLFLLATGGIRERYEKVLDSTVSRQVVCLYGPPDTRTSKGAKGSGKPVVWTESKLLAALKSRIEKTARACGVVLGVVFAVLSIVWFTNLGVSMATPTRAVTTVVGLVLSLTMSIVIGLRAARMASYGWQGVSWSSENIETSQVALNPRLGDPDGLCGLEELSKLYEFLAGRLMWPIVYCAIWLLIFIKYSPAYIDPTEFMRLKMTLWVGLAVLISLEIAGLVAPIGFIGAKLKRDRQSNLEQFKEQVDEISNLEAKLENCAAAQRPGIMAQLTYWRNRREDIYNMPRWPIRGGTLSWFTLRKATPALFAIGGNIWADPPQWIGSVVEMLGWGA